MAASGCQALNDSGQEELHNGIASHKQQAATRVETPAPIQSAASKSGTMAADGPGKRASTRSTTSTCGAISRRAGELIDSFNVKTPSEETLVKSLSGGNIQKLVLARELEDPVLEYGAHNGLGSLDLRTR